MKNKIGGMAERSEELGKDEKTEQWRTTESRLKWNEMKCGFAGGWNKGKANGRKKSQSLLWLVTLTRSCCAQCQSIRHPGLLLMSTGNKSEETGLYFAAWLTCRSRHWPACPCIPPKLTPPELSFTRWESWPLISVFPSISSIHYLAFSPFAAGLLCAFHYLSQMSLLFRRCLVCMPLSCGTQRVSITVT